MEQPPAADIAVLVPARRASTRLPEKLLLAEHGEPLIATVSRRAALAFGKASVVVCADDQALVEAVRPTGIAARLTRADHQSGTDRIAEVAAGLSAGIIVNVQGDEPEMDPEHIRLVAGLLRKHPWAGMATLAVPAGPEAQANPNQVKVVIGNPWVWSGEGRLAEAQGTMASAIPRQSDQAPLQTEGRALWFTRSPAPYDRDRGGPAERTHRHLGIYAYRREVLLGYGRLPPSPLESGERLEQLRALANGIGIAIAVVGHATPGIDVRADYDAFLDRIRQPKISP
ncbi:MAG: 3-deoxy-manno-octulosonate cytidylyltransferase [Planctomycetes bacterium]|nr:3-deoxy-manno-octulosonate cytidylyltransferase [Planctomycetota bacterium]